MGSENTSASILEDPKIKRLVVGSDPVPRQSDSAVAKAAQSSEPIYRLRGRVPSTPGAPARVQLLATAGKILTAQLEVTRELLGGLAAENQDSDPPRTRRRQPPASG